MNIKVIEIQYSKSERMHLKNMSGYTLLEYTIPFFFVIRALKKIRLHSICENQENRSKTPGTHMFTILSSHATQ
jgi:hypothetical protein